MALCCRLSRVQHDLELDKATEAVDVIQVNPGSPHVEHFTLFSHDAAHPENAGKSLRKGSRIFTGHSLVDRFLGPLPVWAIVRNNLTRAVRERADLEPPIRHHEERVRLIDR